MAQRAAFASLAAAVLAACVHAPGSSPAGDAAAEVMRLDAGWAAAMARGDGDGFRALVAEDALFAGRSLLRGRQEVWNGWKGFFAEGGPKIRWTPAAGGAAASGDLAWTTGRFRLEGRGQDGKPAAKEGEYLTVWARDAGGAWRVALDSGLEPAGALGPVERVAVRSLVSKDAALEAAMGAWTLDGSSARRGAWITLREKVGDGWKTLFDGAVEFPPAR